METIKKLVYVLAVSFGLSFLGGVFSWDLAEGFIILLGVVDIVCIVWLIVLVNKNKK